MPLHAARSGAARAIWLVDTIKWGCEDLHSTLGPGGAISVRHIHSFTCYDVSQIVPIQIDGAWCVHSFSYIFSPEMGNSC